MDYQLARSASTAACFYADAFIDANPSRIEVIDIDGMEKDDMLIKYTAGVKPPYIHSHDEPRLIASAGAYSRHPMTAKPRVNGYIQANASDLHSEVCTDCSIFREHPIHSKCGRANIYEFSRAECAQAKKFDSFKMVAHFHPHAGYPYDEPPLPRDANYQHDCTNGVIDELYYAIRANIAACMMEVQPKKGLVHLDTAVTTGDLPFPDRVAFEMAQRVMPLTLDGQAAKIRPLREASKEWAIHMAWASFSETDLRGLGNLNAIGLHGSAMPGLRPHLNCFNDYASHDPPLVFCTIGFAMQDIAFGCGWAFVLPMQEYDIDGLLRLNSLEYKAAKYAMEHPIKDTPLSFCALSALSRQAIGYDFEFFALEKFNPNGNNPDFEIRVTRFQYPHILRLFKFLAEQGLSFFKCVSLSPTNCNFNESGIFFDGNGFKPVHLWVRRPNMRPITIWWLVAIRECLLSENELTCVKSKRRFSTRRLEPANAAFEDLYGNCIDAMESARWSQPDRVAAEAEEASGCHEITQEVADWFTATLVSCATRQATHMDNWELCGRALGIPQQIVELRQMVQSRMPIRDALAAIGEGLSDDIDETPSSHSYRYSPESIRIGAVVAHDGCEGDYHRL